MLVLNILYAIMKVILMLLYCALCWKAYSGSIELVKRHFGRDTHTSKTIISSIAMVLTACLMIIIEFLCG